MNANLRQPFVICTASSATTFSLNDEPADERTVPVITSVIQLVELARRAVNFRLSGRYFATTPDSGPKRGDPVLQRYAFPDIAGPSSLIAHSHLSPTFFHCCPELVAGSREESHHENGHASH